MTVTFDDILDAQRAMGGAIQQTPTLHSETLSAITGVDLYLKFENHQFTSSFKERGALNRLLAIPSDQRSAGVLAVSAGNHAQGVAHHARRLGIPCRIVMPAGTPLTKVRNTRALGADTVVTGTDFDDAAAQAAQLVEESGATMVHPFDDRHVIAGQGTVVVEMLHDVPDLDVLLVPVGGGGLIAGAASAARHLNPSVEVVGVQSEAFSPVARAFGHKPPPSVSTIAEGIAVSRLGSITMPIVSQLVDDVVAVPDEQIEAAIVMLLDIEKTLAEGAGAAGLAAVLQDPERFRGRKVGLIVSGGNIDLRTIADAIARSLHASGRIASLLVEVADRPGQLAEVLAAIARATANVLSVQHDRSSARLQLRHAHVEILVETLDDEHLDRVLAELAVTGIRAHR